jgi:hypothetical protein
MDKQAAANSAVLCGHIYERPVFSHSCHGRDYYTFPIAVPRLSGTEDIIVVIAEKSVIERAEISQSFSVKITVSCGRTTIAAEMATNLKSFYMLLK